MTGKNGRKILVQDVKTTYFFWRLGLFRVCDRIQYHKHKWFKLAWQGNGMGAAWHVWISLYGSEWVGTWIVGVKTLCTSVVNRQFTVRAIPTHIINIVTKYRVHCHCTYCSHLWGSRKSMKHMMQFLAYLYEWMIILLFYLILMRLHSESPVFLSTFEKRNVKFTVILSLTVREEYNVNVLASLCWVECEDITARK
jgi:hypothetical protein